MEKQNEKNKNKIKKKTEETCCLSNGSSALHSCTFMRRKKETQWKTSCCLSVYDTFETTLNLRKSTSIYFQYWLLLDSILHGSAGMTPFMLPCDNYLQCLSKTCQFFRPAMVFIQDPTVLSNSSVTGPCFFLNYFSPPSTFLYLSHSLSTVTFSTCGCLHI